MNVLGVLESNSSQGGNKNTLRAAIERFKEYRSPVDGKAPLLI